MEFATLLQYLYLQNNSIAEIPELPLPNLTKLLLDENHISYVTGLEKCTKLEELRIGNQAFPLHTSLTFDPNSLSAISRTLQALDISGNGISTFSPFSVLRNLRKLFAGDNEVIDLSEVEDIIRLPRLEEAVFLGNPCCNIKRYRDYAVGASSNALKILDNVPVLKHQQTAIRGLMDHRRKLGTAVVDLSLTAGQQQAINEYEQSIGSNNSTILEEGNEEQY
jgi:protein phosphatase 1 regulatory subunit 42